MKTIYSRFNRNRLAAFQTETRVIVDEERGALVKKSPLSEEAQGHIQSIFEHYALLKQAHPRLCPVEPTMTQNELVFPFIPGKTLEGLFFEALVRRDKQGILGVLEIFLQEIRALNTFTVAEFTPCEGFVRVFGPVEIAGNLEVVEVGNIDLIPENMIPGEDGKVHIIDYEWVFPFKIPRAFIFYRGIKVLFTKYHPYLEGFLEEEWFHRQAGLRGEDIPAFVGMERSFQQYVYGPERRNIIRQEYLKKVRKNIATEGVAGFGGRISPRLYLNLGDGFSERRVVGAELRTDGKKFDAHFHVPGPWRELQEARLDPVEGFFCTLTLERCVLHLSDGTKTPVLPSQMSSNGALVGENRIRFDTFDPWAIVPIPGPVEMIEVAGELEIYDNNYVEGHVLNPLKFLNREYETIIATLRNESQQREESLNAMKEAVAAKDDELIALRHQLGADVARLEAHLELITQSNSWKVLRALQKIKDAITPKK